MRLLKKRLSDTPNVCLVAMLFGGIVAPLQAQTCNALIESSTPASRYTLNADGTAVDKRTGLMWMRCSLGQTWDGTTCAGNAVTFNWQTALLFAEAASFAGHEDWYLPNVKELSSLTESACYEPAVNETAFPVTPNSYYWSSTAEASDAWIVFSQEGSNALLPKSSGAALRLVRQP